MTAHWPDDHPDPCWCDTDWDECVHDRAKSEDLECPECGADLAALDDADATPAQVRP